MQTGKPNGNEEKKTGQPESEWGYDDAGNFVQDGHRMYPPQPDVEREQAEHRWWYHTILPDANARELRIAVVRYAGFASQHMFETSTPQRGYDWLKQVAPPGEAAAYHGVVAQARHWAQTPTAAPGVVLHGLPGRGKSALAATLLVDLVAAAYRTQHPDVMVPEPMEFSNRQWRALLDAYHDEGRPYYEADTTPCVYFESWRHMVEIMMTWGRDEQDGYPTAKQERQALWQRVNHSHAMVLDDVELVETAFRENCLLQILEHVEAHRKRLIVTTNLDPSQWVSKLGERAATRLADRQLFELLPMTDWRSLRNSYPRQ